jgi:hypothetical protein
MQASQCGQISRSSYLSCGAAFFARKLLVFDSLRSFRSWSANGQNSTLNRGGGRIGVNVGDSRRAYCSRRALRQARRTLFAVMIISLRGIVGIEEKTLSYSGCRISYWSRKSCAEIIVWHFASMCKLQPWISVIAKLTISLLEPCSERLFPSFHNSLDLTP